MHKQLLLVLVAVLLVAKASAAQPRIETVVGDGDPRNVGQPFGVEFGPDGNLYICDVQNHVVHRWNPRTRETVIVAGNGTKGYSGAPGGMPATKAAMNEPYEIRFDSAGNLYVVEMRNAIVRRIDPRTGIITTIAGTGEAGFSGDGGPATKAQFRQPHSIALDEAKGHLYIADIGNHRIRRVDLKTGIVETFAGNGERKLPPDGEKVGPDKPMIGPRALFIDGRTMWIALREGHSIYKVNLDSGMLRHVAGTGKKGYSGDGGQAKDAQFNGPKGIAVRDGKAYIVDTENQAIRMIDTATGTISTIAGVPSLGKEARGYGGDGGPATEAKMDRPHGICVGADGSVYIGDTNNHRVRRVAP